ncbi:MAG TPA: gamma-glutamyl-gamma-aminobutyrate hydrolase family protein [Caldilineaceae bacterium]|nr:gamma-glutamyl-gamma-aminobutyrate hydrolase family protein [Caldilineaceae bacterium]
MKLELRNNLVLPTVNAEVQGKRPLIGVPTGRENSQRFHGLPLYIMNQTYIRVLENLGALPVMIPLGMSEATLRGIFDRLDGIFLPGGEDIDPQHYGAQPHAKLGTTDPERDRTELLLTRWALAEGMPFLGVCRGIQVLNVACGGSLFQDLPSDCPSFEKHDYMPPSFDRFHISHQIQIESNSRLAQALGERHGVNSMHHQGIDRLGTALRVVARAADGLPEAVEIPALPFVIGVQWHPEEMATRDNTTSGLFYNFVCAASNEWRPTIPVDRAPPTATLLPTGAVSQPTLC